MYQHECIVCGEIFTAKRNDAQTCGDSCRQEALRRKNITQILQNVSTQVDKIGWVFDNTSLTVEAETALQQVRHQIDDILNNPAS